MYRYLFTRYLGADVDKVAQVVPIGNANETLAGMQRGLVQVSAFSPPVAEKAVADKARTRAEMRFMGSFLKWMNRRWRDCGQPLQTWERFFSWLYMSM